jgi:hypothetical protein
MGTALFPIPDQLERILVLLAPSNNFSVHSEGDTFLVLTGDQLAFVARTMAEVHAFLCGAFLVTFGGQRLADIDRPIDHVGVSPSSHYQRPAVKDDFRLIDLASQIAAVRVYVAGWTAADILDWLQSRGAVQHISTPYDDQYLYSFTSPSGIRTGFQLTPDGQLFIVHDHTIT